jgi:uncharacterized RDD family membrane protein YckC
MKESEAHNLEDEAQRFASSTSSGMTAPMPPPGTGDGASAALAQFRSGLEREFAERHALESSLQEKAQRWRQEVASRVEGYRTRRSKKRLSGEFSMKFDFGPPPSPRPQEADSCGNSWQYASSAIPVPESEVSINHDHPARAVAFAPTSEFHAGAADPGPTTSTPAENSVSDSFRTSASQSSLLSAPAPSHSSSREPLGPHTAAAAASPARQTPARETKVIEFPRSLFFPEAGDQSYFDPYELAEPVLDRPRILDVPDTVTVPAPPLADVALEGEPEEELSASGSFELPLRTAPLPQRLTAALIDGLIVLAATGLFAAVVFRGVATLPHSKPVIGLAVILPVLFWALYQYLFLVYAAHTPGMYMLRIRLSTFQGTWPCRNVRRWRALLMVLSCVSLGFGFFWAFLDEDNLCWHDKMTHTYLTSA